MQLRVRTASHIRWPVKFLSVSVGSKTPLSSREPWEMLSLAALKQREHLFCPILKASSMIKVPVIFFRILTFLFLDCH